MSERDVIHQVDALINRHRAPADGPQPSDEDIPLLTDVVNLASGEVHALPDDRAAQDAAAIRLALARELEAWLDEKLPDAVLRVLDGLSDQMITQVAAQARLELLPKLKSALEAKSRPE